MIRVWWGRGSGGRLRLRPVVFLPAAREDDGGARGRRKEPPQPPRQGLSQTTCLPQSAEARRHGGIEARGINAPASLLPCLFPSLPPFPVLLEFLVQSRGVGQNMSEPSRDGGRQYVNFRFLKVDPAWRRLPAAERQPGKDGL